MLEHLKKNRLYTPSNWYSYLGYEMFIKNDDLKVVFINAFDIMKLQTRGDLTKNHT